MAAGTIVAAQLSFQALSSGPASVVIAFTDQPVVREVVSPDVTSLDAAYAGGLIAILGCRRYRS